MTLEKAPEAREDNLDESLMKELETRLGIIFTPSSPDLISDGPEFFARLEADILAAEKRIEINIFSWAADSTGMRIAELINQRAEELEQVDIRVDVLGSLLIGTKDALKDNWSEIVAKVMTSDLHLADLLAMKKDPSVIYKWPPEKVEAFEIALAELANTEMLLRFNPALAMLADNPNVNITFEHSLLSEMDHAKIFGFDDEHTYLGGRNIGDDYSGGYDLENEGWYGSVKPAYWKDYMVRMEGKVAMSHHQYFFDAASKPPTIDEQLDLSGESTKVAFLRNSPGESADESEKQITAAVFALLQNAKEEVIIEHAYLMDEEVVGQLNMLAEKGVKVTILQGKIESPVITQINERFFAQLSEKVKVVKTNEVLHSKFLTVDGRYSLIGSANLTRESLHHHAEAAVLVVGTGPFQEQLQLHAQKLKKKAKVGELARTARQNLYRNLQV